MAYNQDRKYDHWLKLSPKNIAERRAPDMGGMQGKEPPVDWSNLEKENPNDKVRRPWEASGDGTFGEQYDGYKPSYGKAGDEPLASRERVGGRERAEHERTESREEERVERERGEE
jgi:hypothetical protein